MELKKSEQIEKNKYELSFTIDKETFDNEVSAVYRKNVKKMNIPGFRRGKAPRSIIEKLYGKGVFYEEAINNILPAQYEAAVKESGLKVVGRPEFDVESVENGVEMKATVYVKPEVSISGYKGMKANKYVPPVTDKEIDDEIERTRTRNAREIDVTDRAVQSGDKVIIDYDGYSDGERFDGGKAEKYTLKIGSNTFIPGFEDQIIGHMPGDSFDVNVTFPEEYHAENLAGKPAVFKCVLHEIKYDELPELDDEFAKDVSEFDTLAEYREDLKKKAEERNEKSADEKFSNDLVEALADMVEGDIPQAMYDEETENLLRDYEGRLRMQGLDLKTYFKYTGLDLDTMRSQLKPRAEKSVKISLALEKIAELEGLSATEDEITKKYEEYVTVYGIEMEKVREMIPAETVSEEIIRTKAVDLIKENAEVTHNPPEEKKDPEPASEPEKDEAAEAPAEETEAKEAE